MSYMTPDDFISHTTEVREDYFYDICGNETDTLQIKKLFLLLKTKTLFDKELYLSGLLGAIRHKQDKHIELLFNYAEQHKVSFDRYQYIPLFNCACENNNKKLIDNLDEKYTIIKKQLAIEGFSDIQENGKYFVSGSCSDGEGNNPPPLTFYKQATGYYHQDIFSFSINNRNIDMLEMILERNDNKINSTLVEELFVNSFMNSVVGNNKSLLFLMENTMLREIIKNSPIIALFLNEPTEYVEAKEQVKKILSMYNLEENLPKQEKEAKKNKI
jgi:hypothetical protein